MPKLCQRKPLIVVFLALLHHQLMAEPLAQSDLISAETALPAFSLSDPAGFDELRALWGRRKDYRQLCEASLPTQTWAQAEEAKDFQKAYDIAVKWLATCPVVQRVHMWAYGDASKLGDTTRMDLHKRWYQGLIMSVLKTGNGKTPETAWKTISIAEEYAVVQYFGLIRTSQALIRQPLMVDKITVKSISGGSDTLDLYFNPELHFKRLAYELDKN